MDEKTVPKQLKFKYIFSKEYNPTYSNGIYGGVTTSGDIVANFYFERHGLPVSQTQVVNTDGSLGEVIANEPPDLQTSIVRVVESGVILNIATAKAFHDWLEKYIKLAEKVNQAGKI